MTRWGRGSFGARWQVPDGFKVTAVLSKLLGWSSCQLFTRMADRSVLLAQKEQQKVALKAWLPC